MVKARKGWIGVDLGAAAIKLAQLELDGDGVRLSASAVMQRDVPDDASLRDALWSFREIRAALALDRRFRGRTSACLLSVKQAGVRTLSIPAGSEAERRAMIANQLFHAVGPEMTDCEFDYWTSEPAPGGQEAVGAVYVPRSTATHTAQSLARAGLCCEVLDGLPLALARAAQLRAAGEITAVVDWAHTQSLLAIVRQGRPLFVRTLRDCGYRRMLRAVTEQLELSSHDAQQLLSRYGVAGIDPPQDDKAAEMSGLLSQLVAEPLLLMEQELIRTLDHLRMHRPALSPNRMLLCGGGATVRRMDTLLSLRLDLPVDTWRLSRPDAEPTTPAGIEPLLASAAALSALAWNA
jgi:Tfp pilus assembly PilM family ATPase